MQHLNKAECRKSVSYQSILSTVAYSAAMFSATKTTTSHPTASSAAKTSLPHPTPSGLLYEAASSLCTENQTRTTNPKKRSPPNIALCTTAYRYCRNLGISVENTALIMGQPFEQCPVSKAATVCGPCVAPCANHRHSLGRLRFKIFCWPYVNSHQTHLGRHSCATVTISPTLRKKRRHVAPNNDRLLPELCLSPAAYGCLSGAPAFESGWDHPRGCRAHTYCYALNLCHYLL